jgi:GH15 family glucan-1,4-alpha-glucosidase
MSRPIVLSNGELHVGINGYGMVHDLYFPYVGFENHSAGKNLRHHIGVWVDGKISWLYSDEWQFTFRYPHNALIGHVIAKNDNIGIVLEFDDFVDAHISAFIRNIHVVNLWGENRELRIFMHQAFIIGDSRSNTDTAQYLPDSNAVLHYRGRRAFVVSGDYNGKSFDQHTIGLFGIENKKGTYADAEDGELSCNDVEHGRVDSTIRFLINVDANSSQRLHYWIAAGTNSSQALKIHRKIQDEGVNYFMNRTSDWWNEWLEPAYEVLDLIDADHKVMFIQSLMILKSQIDKHGAIIASTDTSMLNYSRDAYAYSWPRDGAYVIWPLIRLGYKHEALNFFQFTKRGLHPDGYLMHKYRADGALGSSWHPYVHENGVVSPPIQEDETALPLFMFALYYQLHPDISLIKEFYRDMVVPMADFLADFVDRTTGLPKPSYDLWEEKFSTSTYTTAVTFAALNAASDLASSANDHDNAVKWRVAATEIQHAAHKYLYNENRKSFYHSVNIIDNQMIKNDVIDSSSSYGAYTFGLFAADSEEIKNSFNTLNEVFGVCDDKPGLPRYENDQYRRASSDAPSNYWYIASLWLAQYHIDNDKKDKAKFILDWVRVHSLKTGVMGEQIDPISHRIVSPAPLTWSHAEYITTILNYVKLGK